MVQNSESKIVKRAFLLAVNSIIHASPELILMRREGFRLNLNGNWEVIVLMRVVLYRPIVRLISHIMKL